MSSPAGPPARPPQISPDGKWFWDGTRWQPIAVHEAIFPTWQSVGAGVPAQAGAAPPAQHIPSPPPQPAQPAAARGPAAYRPPTAAYQMPAPAPQAPVREAPPVPLWRQGRTSSGVTKYMYVGAAVVALIVVGVVLSSMGTITFPWQQSASQGASAPGTPEPTARSDGAQADFLITQQLWPSLASVGDSVAAVRGSCLSGMTTSCQDGLVGVDNKATLALQIIDRQTPPLCISAQLTRLRADLVKLDAAAQLAVKGIKNNQPEVARTGSVQIAPGYAQVQADQNTLSAAAKTCDTEQVGP